MYLSLSWRWNGYFKRAPVRALPLKSIGANQGAAVTARWWGLCHEPQVFPEVYFAQPRCITHPKHKSYVDKQGEISQSEQTSAGRARLKTVPEGVSLLPR